MMGRNICCTITLLMCLMGNAQWKRIIVVFNDGKRMEGLGKLSGETILFKNTKRAKRIKYPFAGVDTLKMYPKRYDPHIYVNLKVEGGEAPVMASIGATGDKLTLYRKFESYFTTAGGPGFGPAMPSQRSITSSYLKRTGEEAATFLGTDHLFNKNFKKAASDYFSDCPALVNRIRKGELRRRDLEAIVHHYNEQCD